MKRSVIAVGLDSADPHDIEAWADAGWLPNIDELRRSGMYGRICNTVPYAGRDTSLAETEILWVMAQTGCFPTKSGYWGSVDYDPRTYAIAHSQRDSGYGYHDFAPFYALGQDYRVCVFDVPVSNLHPDVHGIQITGWGGHFPFSLSRSEPPEVYSDIVARYGENPIFLNDSGHFWDSRYIRWERQALAESIETRTAIASELLRKEDWDLFLLGFGETHTAGHDLFHLSHPESPIHPRPPLPPERSPMVETFRHIDAAIGRLFAEAPQDSIKLVFSVHGITANHVDLASFLFLPELMYRYNFGKPALCGRGRPGTPPGPVVDRPVRNSWATSLWLQRAALRAPARLAGRWMPRRFLREGRGEDLVAPQTLGPGNLAWMPARWFSRSWPRMKAFALPCFAEGHVRVNLIGRESRGIVSPHEYGALLDDIADKLQRVRCARTGEPLVKEVARTRDDPLDRTPNQPGPDLVVVWNEHPTDVVESPELGRIGPVPYFRPGGHSPRGFLAAAGGGIPPGSTFPAARAVDIAPTVRSLLGAPIPAHYDGRLIVPDGSC